MKKNIAIMQPTFIPWLGYFSLIKYSDTFVFLDDVQFEKRSWQQRNRINSKNGELFISLPVFSKKLFEQKILEVEIVSFQNFYNKLLRTLKHNYGKALYYDECIEAIQIINFEEAINLCDINIKIIKLLSNRLGIKTEFLSSSDLSMPGKKSTKLLNLCQKIGNCNYLSVPGSINYINEEGSFAKSHVPVFKFIFKSPEYYSVNTPFLKDMSIIDAVMNIGFNKTAELLDLFTVDRVLLN